MSDNGKPIVLDVLATEDRPSTYANATWVIKLESQIILWRVRVVKNSHGWVCEAAVMGNCPLDFTLVATAVNWDRAYKWLVRES